MKIKKMLNIDEEKGAEENKSSPNREEDHGPILNPILVELDYTEPSVDGGARAARGNGRKASGETAVNREFTEKKEKASSKEDHVLRDRYTSGHTDKGKNADNKAANDISGVSVSLQELGVKLGEIFANKKTDPN